MKRLFLINTKPIDRGVGGGKIIRIAQRNFFEKSGFHVWEIAAVIDQENNIDYSKGVVYIHQNGSVLKLLRGLQKLNLIEDYLDLWIKSTFNSIKDLIKKDDIVFSLSGGELSTIKLGSIIKKNIGCKFIINFHDPLLFTTSEKGVIASAASKFPQRNRNYLEKKYLQNVDLIITSSKEYSHVLKRKYPTLNIKYSHFGYRKKRIVVKKKPSKKFRIVYGGSFSEIQKPEILLDAVINSNHSNLELYLIGDHKKYSRFKKYKIPDYKNLFYFKDQMSPDEYEDFVTNQIDVGFLSLSGVLSELCVPSKLFDFINLEIPVLGVIKGDGQQIIEDNKIGVVCSEDKKDILSGIQNLMNKKNFNQFKNNIKKLKPDWSFDSKFENVINLINNS